MMDDKPTLGSLFAGIGGIDLGFERAGFKTVWQVEIEPYCRKVLARHFPVAERFEDVRNVGKHNLRPVDVLAGGFPCQDISNAGKRAGIDGERSGLWSEYARIIGELRPRFVFVENVAALLVRGIDRVLGDLASHGYDAEWEVISAADVGAPHLRRRLWIVAYPQREGELQPQGCERQERRWVGHRSQSLADTSGSGLAQRVLLRGISADASRADARKATFLGSEVPDATRELPHRSGRARDWWTEPTDGSWWFTEPGVGRVAHGVPSRVDRLKGLGNAVVPQIPELIARRLYSILRPNMTPRHIPS